MPLSMPRSTLPCENILQFGFYGSFFFQNMDIQKSFQSENSALQFLMANDLISYERKCLCTTNMKVEKRNGKPCWICPQCRSMKTVFFGSIFEVCMLLMTLT